MPAKKSVAGKFVIEFCKVENLADNIDVYLTWDKSKSKVVTTKNKAADFTNESFEKNITVDKMKSILVLPTPSKIKIYQKNADAKAKDMLIGMIILDYTLFTGMKERLFNFQIAINAVGILYPMLSLKITCDWSIGDKFGNWKKVDPEEPIVPEKKKKKKEKEKKEKKDGKERKEKAKEDKEEKIGVDNNEVESSPSSETTSSKSPSVENNLKSSDVEVKLLNKEDKKDSKKEKEPESSDDEDNTSKEEQAEKDEENTKSDEESSSEYSSEESSEEEEEEEDDDDDDTSDGDDDSDDENEDDNNKIQVKEISVTSDEDEEDD